jgi:hypothetical protein
MIDEPKGEPGTCRRCHRPATFCIRYDNRSQGGSGFGHYEVCGLHARLNVSAIVYVFSRRRIGECPEHAAEVVR